MKELDITGFLLGVILCCLAAYFLLGCGSAPVPEVTEVLDTFTTLSLDSEMAVIAVMDSLANEGK